MTRILAASISVSWRNSQVLTIDSMLLMSKRLKKSTKSFVNLSNRPEMESKSLLLQMKLCKLSRLKCLTEIKRKFHSSKSALKPQTSASLRNLRLSDLPNRPLSILSKTLRSLLRRIMLKCRPRLAMSLRALIATKLRPCLLSSKTPRTLLPKLLKARTRLSQG